MLIGSSFVAFEPFPLLTVNKLSTSDFTLAHSVFGCSQKTVLGMLKNREGVVYDGN